MPADWTGTVDALVEYNRNTGQRPLLRWDGPDTDRPVKARQNGDLYRVIPAKGEKDNRIENPIGLPGKRYDTWMDWYYDYLKLTLRVHYPPPGVTLEAYRRAKYTNYLETIKNLTDARSCMERQIMTELLAELEPEMETVYG